MKLFKKTPKLIFEFVDDKEGKGFFLYVRTEGDVCDKYILAAADYTNNAIKASKKDVKNVKNRRR